ncbi:MAG: hypothetical protein ACT6FC_05025 [Methanosarcinaceae archaeon]
MQPSEHMDFAQGVPAFSEISDMKMASSREIKLMRKGERRILEYPMGTERDILTHGDVLSFTLNTSDAHFLDTNRMYIKAEMAIIDNSEVKITPHAGGYHHMSGYPSCFKGAETVRHQRSLFHLAHGTHTLFDRMIVKNGSETIEDNKSYHQSNIMKAIMGHSAVPKDDICGYWNADSLVADPNAMYNVKHRKAVDPWEYHNDITFNTSNIQFVPVIIPVANVLENQPYLALHNFASTLELEMHIAPATQIFTPLIDEERLDLWNPEVPSLWYEAADDGSYTGLNFDKIDVVLGLRRVKLVVEGLLLDDVTQLNTVSQSFPAIMVQSFQKTQPESTNVSQLITVQRPALKYLTVAAVRREAFVKILATDTNFRFSELYKYDPMLPTEGSLQIHPLYSLKVIAEHSGLDRYSIFKFFEMPFNQVETVIGGTGYPKNFDKQSNLPRGRYMELAKEFQDYSTGGSAALPAYPYSRPRPRGIEGVYEKFGMHHGILGACPLHYVSNFVTSGIGGFRSPILDNLCTYHNDKFATRDSYPAGMFPDHPEHWWDELDDETPEAAGIEMRAGKNILFFNYSRLIGEDASVIGAINTNTSQMNLTGELGVPWSPDYDMMVFAFYQVVLQLNAEVGSIDQFN